jgi:alkyldihydroxyacetonephosphate synthase
VSSAATVSAGDELGRAVGEPHVQNVGDGAWMVSPGSPAEVAEVVAIARRHRLAVRPVGTGTKPIRLTGPRVQISTRRMDHVIHLDETSLLVHVQAGITGLALEKVLAPRGLSIGDYSPSILGSSLGGIIAVRTPGKSSARHGFFEDAVVGLSAVLADGRTLHTRVAPRRSTGPDLGRALCGSEGTIGFITSAVLRIHRRPESRMASAYVLPSVDAAVRAVYLALREEAAPAGLRIYDASEAEAHFGQTVIGVHEALLVAATAGPTDLAACDRDLVSSAVTAEGGGPGESRLAEIWWRRLHHGEPTPGPAPTLQVTATPGSLRPVYRAVRDAVIDAGGQIRAHVSRFDADGAVVFFTIGGTGSRAEQLREVAEAAAREAGGWLLGARATRLDPYLAAFQQALDPLRIMNPGALEA